MAQAMTLNFTRHRQLTHRLLPGIDLEEMGRVINIPASPSPRG